MKLNSKITVLTMALTMLSAASAQAGGKSDFTPVVLAKVQSAKSGLDNLRVYLNRELLVVRSGLVDKNTDVNGGVKTVIREKELTEVLSPKASGKVVAVEGADGSSRIVLYVSFDPACTAKECAYKFVEQGSDYCYYVCRFKAETDSPFVLSEVAPNADYSTVKLYKKSVLFFTTDASTDDFTLRVRDSELLQVLRESRRLPGWNGSGRSGD